MWWPLRRALVVGESMLPTYRPGDVLLWRPTTRVRPGDVVVVDLPGDRPLGVKRLGERQADGSWELVSDNPVASTDSRAYGPVLASAIRGRVLARLYRLQSPPSKATS